MKVILICLFALLITACNSMPVFTNNSFPSAPAELMVPPDELKTLKPISISSVISPTDDKPSDVTLSALTKIITDNYKLSNQFREQIKGLQNWIIEQRKLNP